MTIRFGSVCSGIEAASCAWHPLGWETAFVSEIEPFPSAVLAHHYPTVPNLGDMTQFKEWPDAAIDLLVGGTPCQSFSVAGLRKGLADPRGNLMLTYLAIAKRYAPRWLVWENVPGVLSSNGGRDFGTFLGGLAELGYGFAYRILDAQFFGVAQRRRRVFVVGCLGDWRRAAAVLFERESLLGHPAPSRETWQRVAGTIAPGAHPGGHNGQDDDGKFLIAHALRGEGFDASEDGTGRGTPLIPCQPYTLAIRGRDDGNVLEYRQDGTANAILTPNGGRGGIGIGAIAFDTTQITSPTNRSNPRPGDPCHPIASGARAPAVGLNWQAAGKQTTLGGSPVSSALVKEQIPGVQIGSAVRRLTPRECERLQGFPDDYTLITVRGKPAADGPRYKALGNSMARPVMYWIGKRIQLVESLTS
ncbi:MULTISPECIES: DNA cytosine methyltransferase [unclassified Burkholderia]|uniref:DNA cytosine methyltransferase n=1 Tax=Burkholderia sp. AU32357 TaxID=2824811 RepID=UPI001B8E3B9A|nr:MULTISPECIES: DNA cytosine methyltransferase [unclassified Burkholderia]MBR8234213.1 DNA cytosine methyltransferase [Burkholderia sp. AU32357]